MALEFREGDSLVIQADLPGIDADRDIDIWISHDILHVRASTMAGIEPRERPSDLRYGSFTRDIALPPGTLEDQVRATYHEGRLEIRAPFSTTTHPVEMRIPVVTVA